MYLREKKVYYIQNNSTGERESLRTKDKQEAERLLEVRNSAGKATALNLELGKVYLRAADPKMASRTAQPTPSAPLRRWRLTAPQTPLRRRGWPRGFGTVKETVK